MLSGMRPAVGLTRVVEHVTDNRGNVAGVVVTGGEPTMDPNLSQLLRGLRSLGIPVKIDTNGTFPEVLETLIEQGLVSFVSMDVKATPERYDSVTAGRDVWKHVHRSISLLIESGVDHEFRTTCYPGAVLTAELPYIARELEGGMRFAIQQFQPQRTLDPAASGVRPYDADALRRAALCCAVHLPSVVRGV
jgi:pyruvate formate lyase activating enzyme